MLFLGKYGNRSVYIRTQLISLNMYTCTGGTVIEDEKGEIASTCCYSSLCMCNTTCLDTIVLYI